MKSTKLNREKIGKILSDARLISSKQLAVVLEEQEKTGKRLGDILVENGIITEQEIAHAYSVHLGLPYRSFDYIEISPDALKIVTKEFAERHGIIPVDIDDKCVTFAVSDPFCDDIIDSIVVIKGKKVEINISTPTEIRKAIHGVYLGGETDRLGDILIDAGLITAEKLEMVLTHNRQSKKRLGELLIEKNYVSESDIVQALSLQMGVPYTDLTIAKVEQNAIDAIPEALAIKHLILPLNILNNTITVVMSNPLDTNAVDAVNAAIETGMDLKVTVSTYTEIKEAIDKYYSHNTGPEKDKDTTVEDINADAPLVNSKKFKRELKLGKTMIGAILVGKGLLTLGGLDECLEIQKKSKKKIGRILVDHGYVKEIDIVEALSEQLKIPCTDLTAVMPNTKTFESIPVGFAERFLLLPVFMDNKTITVVMANPLDKKTIDEIAYITGKKVKVSIASHIEIRKAIQQFYRDSRPKKLGEILVDSGLVTAANLADCLEAQKTSKQMLGEIFIEKGYVKEEGIALAFSKQMGIPYTNLSTTAPALGAIKLITQAIAEELCMIPLAMDARTITIAIADPLNLEGIREIREITSRNVKITVAPLTAINNMILECYQFSESFKKMGAKVEVIESDTTDVFQTGDDALKKSETKPIISIVNNMITDAIKLKASDIHIEMGQSSLVVRNRVDGLLRETNYLPKWVQWPVVSRVKIMAKLNIAERRIPQDGRIKVRAGENEVDLRVSTIPSQYGEKVVIRLLDPTTAVLKIDEMGISSGDYARLTDMIEKPQGIVLVTGPTGSGKTSTLYAMMNHIKDPTKNIITLEDPIEYELEGINQIGINPRLPFATALRAVLRQDPDVILIGEMRDSETADIAVQASITGHLVISTLHTNTAVAAINRLKNLGVKPFMIASSLNGIIAQRLVRKVCSACKEPYKPTEDDLSKVGLIDRATTENFQAYKGKGCPVCNKTGNKGRSGVFEILTVDSKMRNLIINEATEEKISHAARDAGMKYMIEDGIAKVKRGDISIIDLPRVVSNDEDIEEIFTISCSRCGEGLSEDFHICPYCGLDQKNRCTKCDRAIKPEWKYCPYCSMKFNRSQVSNN